MQDETVTISNVLVPTIILGEKEKGGSAGNKDKVPVYRHVDVVIKEKRILSVTEHDESFKGEGQIINGKNKLLLPG